MSKSLPLIYSVPQGTVLGPLLFIVFINDLCNLKIKGKIITFADDTVILFEGNNWDEVYKVAEEQTKVVKQWIDSNLLSLNLTKTFHIAFSLNNLGQPTDKTLNIHSNKCQLPELECSYWTKIQCKISRSTTRSRP